MVRQQPDLNNPNMGSPLPSEHVADTLALRDLHGQWIICVIAGMILVVAGYFLLTSVWEAAFALRWAIVTSAIVVYEMIALWRGLRKNHPPRDLELLPQLGLGNVLSITRGMLVASVAGFLLCPRPEGWLAWTPAILYITGDILDYLDGLVARLTKHQTELGEYLDLEFDGLSTLVGPLLGILYGQFPIWYFAVSAARYLFVTGLWILKQYNKPSYPLTPSNLRRVLAGFQMSFIGVALLPVFSPAEVWIAAGVFMVPFMASFIRDWLIVSGTVQPASSIYQVAIRQIESIFGGFLPIGLRVIVLISSISLGLFLFNAAKPVQGLVMISACILISMGIAARTVSLLLLITTGLLFPIISPSTVGLIISTAALTLLGSGKLSIWKPEEYFLSRRFG